MWQIKEFTYTYIDHSATVTQKKPSYYSLSVFLNASAIFTMANKKRERTMSSTTWKMRLKDSPQVIQEYQENFKKLFLVAISRGETKLATLSPPGQFLLLAPDKTSFPRIPCIKRNRSSLSLHRPADIFTVSSTQRGNRSFSPVTVPACLPALFPSR